MSQHFEKYTTREKGRIEQEGKEGVYREVVEQEQNDKNHRMNRKEEGADEGEVEVINSDSGE